MSETNEKTAFDKLLATLDQNSLQHDTTTLMLMAATRINRLESRIAELEAERRWIPVSEPPEDTKPGEPFSEYNVCDRKGNVYSAIWNNGTWMDYEGDTPGLYEIACWRPLPPPPSDEVK